MHLKHKTLLLKLLPVSIAFLGVVALTFYMQQVSRAEHTVTRLCQEPFHCQQTKAAKWTYSLFLCGTRSSISGRMENLQKLLDLHSTQRKKTDTIGTIKGTVHSQIRNMYFSQLPFSSAIIWLTECRLLVMFFGACSLIPFAICVYCFQKPQWMTTSKLATCALKLASYSNSTVFANGTNINKWAAARLSWGGFSQFRAKLTSPHAN